MLKEPPWWQIGRPLRRPFSLKATIFTYVLILLVMSGVIVVTILTKGYNLLCESKMYESTDPRINNATIFDSCKPTSVYPGQTFFARNNMFVYEALALGNMTKPHALTNCSLLDGSYVSSLNFPASNPNVKFGMNFICNTTGVSSKDHPITEYAGTSLYPNMIALGIKELKISEIDPENKWRSELIKIGKRFKDSDWVCDLEKIIGFNIYTRKNEFTINYISDNVNGSVCSTTGDVDNDDFGSILTFFNHTIDYAMTDFKSLSPLPNLIFECPRCAKARIPIDQLAWNIAVGLGSTWSVMLLLTTTFVARTTNSYDRTYDVWVEAVQMAQSKPDTPAFPPFPYGRLHKQASESEANQYLLSKTDDMQRR